MPPISSAINELHSLSVLRVRVCEAFEYRSSLTANANALDHCSTKSPHLRAAVVELPRLPDAETPRSQHEHLLDVPHLEDVRLQQGQLRRVPFHGLIVDTRERVRVRGRERGRERKIEREIQRVRRELRQPNR